MKTSLFACSAITLLLVSSSAFADRKNFTATMTGAGEVPPVTTAGTGTAALTFDTVTKKLCGSITYQNLSSAVQGAHLHVGAIGDDGGAGNPAYVNFTGGDAGSLASPISVDDTLDSDQEAKLLTVDGTYVNVHTVNNQDGEIRGELTEDPTGTDQCPDADGGATDDGGTSSSSSSSGSSGATTTRADGGDTPAESSSSSSCSMSPGGSSSPLFFAAATGVAIALASRKRKKR